MASFAADAQCVLARRPSKRPAAASTNAPVHTDVTRRVRLAAALIQSSVATSALTAAEPAPPGTIRVSILLGASTRLVSGTISRPLEVVIGAPSRLAIVMR